MTYRISRGFTLVELLIVISIIGILASVVFSSLNDARKGGIDAKIKAQMDSIQKEAAVIELRTGAFDEVCGSNSVTQNADLTSIVGSINAVASSTLVCNSDTTAYAVSVPLGTANWCVDNIGSKKEIASELGVGELVCP